MNEDQLAKKPKQKNPKCDGRMNWSKGKGRQDKTRQEWCGWMELMRFSKEGGEKNLRNKSQCIKLCIAILQASTA